MKTLFYEDIQLLPHHDVQKIVTWYERWMLKESRFLVAHKSEVGYELNSPTSELVLYGRMLAEDGDTLEQLKTNLKALGYRFKHKEIGERTEEVNAVIMKIDKNYPNWTGRVIEGYLFLDYKSLLYEKEKRFLDYEFIDMMFRGSVNDERKHGFSKHKTDSEYRILFYEDIEEITVEALEELIAWYDKRVNDLNAYYVEQRKILHEEQAVGIKCYKESKLNSVIRYSVNTITAETQEELVTALARQDYQFQHKAEGERTEQPTAKLLKVTGDGQLERYVFLGLKEHVCPVPESERYYEQDRDT